MRAFAYDALRAAPSALWAVLPGALDDALPAVVASVPELASTGARWSGAGVLTGLSTEWWAFDGQASSVLLFTSTSIELARIHLELRRASLDLALHAAGSHTPPPRAVLQACTAARARPVWELPGFARHAPRALLESGFATLAA